MRRSPGRTRILLSALVLVALLAVVFVVAHQASAPAGESPSQPTGQFMTMDPLIIANLTQIPHATPLAGQEANDMAGLRALVDACAAYDAGRLKQMNEQIDFIMNPALLPPQMIIALGSNPRGRLLFAIGTVTANRWQLDNKPGNSCLIPIGRRINQLLVAAGEPPLTIFEGG